MSVYSIPTLVGGVISICLGIFVYLNNRKSALNQIFFAFLISLSVWLFAYSVCYSTKDVATAVFFARIACTAVVFLAPTSYHFVVTFVNKKNELKFVYISYVISLIMILIFLKTNIFLCGVHKYYWGFYSKAGILHPLFLLYFFSTFIRDFIILASTLYKNKDLSPTKRHQIIYVLIGFIMPMFASIDFVPKYGFEIFPFGFTFVLIFAFVISYAIARHRLMDIEVIIRRAVIFAGLFGFVFFVFALTAGLAQMYLSQIISSKVLALAISVLAITVFYDPLKKWLISLTDRFLFQKEYDYQTLLREASKDMSRITDMRELLASIVHIFSSKLRLDNAGIYLLDKEVNKFIPQDAHIGDKFNDLDSINNNIPLIQWLEQSRAPLVFDELEMLSQGKNVSRNQQLLEIRTQMKAIGASVIVPSFTENTLYGFLILGDKLSGRVYNQEDLNVLQVLSNQAALAIENCQFWQDVIEKERKARLQEMDAYSYSLAHEIDNPMQVILGHVTLIKDMLLDLNLPEDKLKAFLESLAYISDSRERVSGMIRAIRDFGQKITGEFRPLNIEDVVESFSKLYYPQFKNNTVVFEKISQLKGPVYVKGEKPELMQALVILANNSFHAMKDLKEKKAFLTLSLLNHSQVRIVFSDNGYGIKKEMLSVIFMPFTSTKPSTEGTGMGLYNAKKIIERHKGKIWAESEGPGKGASFIIELPIAKDVTEEELKK